MAMILSWVLFPLVMVAVGLGWGALVEWAAGARELGALAIPLGLAAAIVAAALMTAFSASAPAAAPIVAAVALAGLGRAWRRTRIPLPALLAGAGVLVVYGAPVILSGEATFLGYVRLDDTATWLGFIDQFFQHGRSLAALDPHSAYYQVLFDNIVQSGYPSGGFMLDGIGHWITGIDAAWIFQPTLAVCAGALALCCYELIAPITASAWLRAFAGFIAAQSALLYGYAAWGGMKELAAAFLLALCVAAAMRLLSRPRTEAPLIEHARAAVPVAVAASALIVTLGPGTLIYLGPLAAAMIAALLARGRVAVRPLIGYVAALPLIALLMLPTWLTLHHYLQANGGFAPSATPSAATAYGNLIAGQPIRFLQLTGIWLDGDFRSFPSPPSPAWLNLALVWIVLIAAGAAILWTLWRRSGGIALYVMVALVALAILRFDGAVPWLLGKSMAFSSPALLLAGLAGGVILFSQRNVVAVAAGVVVLGAIAGGVLWSNFEQYHNVTLAPRARLAELAKIGGMVANRGPTFFNEYEIYGDRHFLRAGDPVEPAERRPVNLPTLGDAVLTDPAWANIDSFGISTLAPYRSLVLRVGPTESRPSSLYGRRPVWQGTYYSLWEQSAHPAERVIQHVPLGDNVNDAYCGNAENAPGNGLCPIQPASVPVCSQVHSLASVAAADGGSLLAYERTNPIVVRGMDTNHSPAQWYQISPGISPASPGASASWQLRLSHAVRDWRLWLGGTFQRGFTVAVDGRTIGSIADQLNPVGAYNRVGPPLTLSAGAHTVTVTYRSETLAPGSADTEGSAYEDLTAIALSPPLSQGRYLTVAPSRASSLCGRVLDWIEVVAPA